MKTEKYGTNPYFEKWKRGRPSKEAIAKRKLANYWRDCHKKQHPDLYPFTNYLLNCDDNGKVIKSENSKGRIRSVDLDYKIR